MKGPASFPARVREKSYDSNRFLATGLSSAPRVKDPGTMRYLTTIAIGLVVGLFPSGAISSDPDELLLPPGFKASVVAENIKGARHLAFRDNGDLFVSTRGATASGIVALRLGPDHKVQKMEAFGSVKGGTGIRVYRNALYASSPTSVYRFSFNGDALVPSTVPEVIVDGMPANGFSARPLAFDDQGRILVGVGGVANICADERGAKGVAPKGLNPCPDLLGRAGIWRFHGRRSNQRFPLDGEQVATGIRDIDALDWRRGDGLFGVVHDRNGISRTWPGIISPSDERAIPEEMHRFTKGEDLGWPYAYFNSERNIHVIAPEYGGDGKAQPTSGRHSKPLVSFPGHSSPLDLVFYNGRQFPRSYQGGAFVVFHGGLGPDLAEGHNGYNVMFVPFDRRGRPGQPSVFADGFAGPMPGDRNVSRAKYRPVGAAVGPDGGLYVIDSKEGRIWRISYK